MKLLFPVLVAIAISLAAPSQSISATLSRGPAGDQPGENGLPATNAPTAADISGMIVLPEKDSGAATGATRGRGAAGESSARAGGEPELAAAARRLRRANVETTFVADTTTAPLDSGAEAGPASAAQPAASAEAEAAIRAMQQSGVVAVPEPSTYALLAAGAALLALRKRSRNARAVRRS